MHAIYNIHFAGMNDLNSKVHCVKMPLTATLSGWKEVVDIVIADISFPFVKMMTIYISIIFCYSQLVKASVLTVRDVGSWWLAIPCAGIYMKSFIRGRKAMLTMIRKCKYKEILQKVSGLAMKV